MQLKNDKKAILVRIERRLFCIFIKNLNAYKMLKKSIIFSFLLAFLIACNPDGENPVDSDVDNFDRGAMLENLADNIIIPAYQDFAATMTTLRTAGETFSTTPNTSNLDSFRTAWYEAYKSWQYVEMYEIGLAENLQYRLFMNIYPLSDIDVENNVSTGVYDLNANDQHDAQGFAALDYLLYGVAVTDAEILAKYTTDANASGYKTYTTDILTKMDELTQQVLGDWTSSYRSIFVNSTANTASSSVNKIVNDFIFYYEKGLRANKVGIPAGVFSATPLADKVEALYRKDISKELALISLQGVENFFNGISYNDSSNGQGFDDYLDELYRADLITAINDQIEAARIQLNALNSNFNQQVIDDNVKMLQTYDELQKVVVMIKSDMRQAFNVGLDFQDGDGDG